MPPEPARLVRWQILTVGLLVVGYSGFYLCRSNLAVCLPLIRADLAARGLDAGAARDGLGWMVSLGTVAYSLGKFGGGLTDLAGGRRSYLAGMAGAVIFTALFALGGSVPYFTLAWFGNRLVQSIGWPGIVKIVSRWFSYSTYGAVMGVVSLSYLFGDAAARWFMGRLLGVGLGWRGVFGVAAATLSALLVVHLLLLRESPARLGLAEPEADPANVFGPEVGDDGPSRLGDLFGTLLRTPAFWLVCGLSMALTLLRETFNTWTNTYFVDGVGLTPGQAADASALFPLLGGVSVIVCGVLSDRLGRGGRAALMLAGLVLAGGVLIALGAVDLGGARGWPIGLVATAGFLLIGPYSVLAGAIALDFGGKRGGATASGLVDGFGYIGGVAAGAGAAKVAGLWGWPGVFVAMAAVAWVAAAVALAFLVDQVLRLRSLPAQETLA